MIAVTAPATTTTASVIRRNVSSGSRGPIAVQRRRRFKEAAGQAGRERLPGLPYEGMALIAVYLARAGIALYE